MPRWRPGLYLPVLLAMALVSGVGVHFGGWAVRVASCRVSRQPGAYLAYCEHPLYGSYEHEAYALGFEPEAVLAMRQATILFLGNSRLQFAFSTSAVDEYFRQRSLSYHLLGFGYGESSKFPRILLDRYRPTPRVVIINADPFFNPVFSPAAYELFLDRRAAWRDAVMKKAFGLLHRLICRVPGRCSDTVPASYRDIRTGQWIWHDVLLPRATTASAVTGRKVASWSGDDLARWQAEADTFLAELPVPRSCIVLTGVPTPQVDAEGMAAALGRRLGVTVVQPDVPGLMSVDDSHLAAESAERWSAAFLDAATATIRACTAP